MNHPAPIPDTKDAHDFLDLRVGVEQEFFLIKKEDLKPANDPPSRFFDEAVEALGNRVSHESKVAQIEMQSRPVFDLNELLQETARDRDTLVQIANKHGLEVVAQGSLKSAFWESCSTTPSGRYLELKAEIGRSFDRLNTCATHVHIEVPDVHLKYTIFNAMRPIVGVLSSMACSSPYWAEQRTRVCSYRAQVFDAFPRSGIPPYLHGEDHIFTAIDNMKRAGSLKGPGELWWDMRCPTKYPTIEVRALDSIGTTERLVSIVWLLSRIVRHLTNKEVADGQWPSTCEIIMQNNRWEAIKRGTKGKVILSDGESVQIGDWIQSIIPMISSSNDTERYHWAINTIKDICHQGSEAELMLAGQLRCR